MARDNYPFVEWAMEKMEDPQFYIDLLRELPRKAANFYSHDPKEIKQKLRAKLIKGSEEHGNPLVPPDRVAKELEAEYLDLIGWSLIGMFYEQYRRDHA